MGLVAINLGQFYALIAGRTVFECEPLHLAFDPENVEIQTSETSFVTLPKDYVVENLLVPVFRSGKCVYEPRSVLKDKAYARQNLEALNNRVKRLVNPQLYEVGLHPSLYQLKVTAIIEETKKASLSDANRSTQIADWVKRNPSSFFSQSGGLSLDAETKEPESIAGHQP